MITTSAWLRANKIIADAKRFDIQTRESRKEIDRGYGFKFLNPYGATEHEGLDFVYPLPLPHQKWGEWVEHPDPAEPDGKDCGAGRLHVMNKLSAEYAPSDWWPWFCEWKGLIGSSYEKVGVERLRLRRISRRTFWKIIRMGYCQYTNLMGVDLTGADLIRANLRRANLTEANLKGANLTEVNLTGVNLTRANLKGARLWRANLTGADLTGVDLTGADLRGADLAGANLTEATLREADLTGADLMEAINKDKAIGLDNEGKMPK